MNLHGLGKVETYQTYLDMAFTSANKTLDTARQQAKGETRIIKSRKIEEVRIRVIGRSLQSNLEMLGKKFPNIDELDPFYVELIKCTLDYTMLKKSLAALGWAKRQIQTLQREYTQKIRRVKQLEQVNKTRAAFSGRVSSVMKQIRKNLEYLEHTRKVMRQFPSIKTGRKTIAFAGAPNVGKSTLLSVLTSSKPQVAHYPFTTKKLNIGYDSKKRQYIDTPGLLDRPIADRNPIERQAILAIKHVADIIVFVVDPTEECGYTIAEQRNLLNEVRKRFKLPIIVVANKADKPGTFRNSIEVSAKENIGIDELKKEIEKMLSEENQK